MLVHGLVASASSPSAPRRCTRACCCLIEREAGSGGRRQWWGAAAEYTGSQAVLFAPSRLVPFGCEAPAAAPAADTLALVWCAQVRRTRAQMHKSIDPDYYGFRDEEDGLLVRVEAEAEVALKAQVGARVAWGAN